MARTELDQLFANLRRPVFVEDANAVPQEIGSRNGNPMPTGWLEDDSVSSDVLQVGAVEAGHITAGAVTTDKLAANAVTAAKIAANTITANEIAANAVTASEIAANTITASEIAANAITASELASNSVTTNKIVAGDVTSSRMEVDISGKTFGANSGSAGAPGYYFSTASTSGMFWDGVGSQVGFVSGGVIATMTLNSSRVAVHGNLRSASDNTDDLGSSSQRWHTVYAGTGTINTSDEREKTDIQDSPLGLAFIRSLKARAFRWRNVPDTQAREQAEAAFDQRAYAKALTPHTKAIESATAKLQQIPADDKRVPELTAKIANARAEIARISEQHEGPIREANAKRRPGRRLHLGLVAQEVKAAMDAAGVDVGLWQQDRDGRQSLAYTELTAAIVKAIQEQADQIETLQAEVAELKEK